MPVGDGPLRGPPGADAEPAAPPGAAAHRRRHQDRPRRGDRRHAGRRGVRHRHGVADRHGLHHGAAVPFQHLPGRRLHPGPEAARQVRRARRRRSSTCSASSPRRCARSWPQLGCRSLHEVVGRTDLLQQVSRGARYLDDLDLNPLLAQADPAAASAVHCTVEGRNEVPDTLDAQMIRDAAAAVRRTARRCSSQYSVRNTHRAVGTRLAADDHPQVRHGGPAARPPSRCACAARPASRSAPSPCRA